MAKTTWMGTLRTAHGRLIAGLALGLIAVFFRLWQWRLLPPGISTQEAASAVSAHSRASWELHAATGFSPLWEALTGLSIGLFGHTITSLRLVAVIISLLGIVATYAWVSSWYDRRTAWVAAFLMAVIPWSVTLSRNAMPAIFAPLALGLLLWTLAGVVRKPNSPYWVGGLTAAVILALKIGPWGWLAIVATIVTGLVQRKAFIRSVKQLSKRPLMTAFFTVMGFGSIIATSWVVLGSKQVFAAFPLAQVSSWPLNLISVIGMFFYHGDANFFHNLGGEPMLNAFIALAFVAGTMVLMSRYQRARDRAVLCLLGFGLLPAIIGRGSVPDASHAALALPIVCLAAAIGIFYLLDLWTATFPVNSAARSMGLTAIGFLLVLTFFQSYTQYFVAWANSSETYLAYNRSAVAASLYAKSHHNEPQLTLVGSASEHDVATYLVSTVPMIDPTALANLSNDVSRSFIITAASHDAVVPQLEKRFAGGIIKAHLDRDGSELYYDYNYKK